MYNISQEQTFLLFFIIGIIIGLLFDIFRVIRKVFRASDKTTFFEDLIFIILSGFLVVYGIIKINGGEVRFYLFLGIMFGILIYILTISNLCAIILYEFLKICKKILKIPYNFIKNFVFFTIKTVKKVRKKGF